jgi:RNA methyltransferase, TrmH family
VERITSRQNSVVAQYRAAARGETGDVLLLDGAHLVNDALTARIPLQHVMVAAESQESSDIQPLVVRAVAQQTMVAVASAKVMEAASPVRSTSPIIALANRNKLASDVYAARQPFVLIACDIQDPGNLGAITRVAEAAGASGLIAAGQSADPLGWKALRGSMGSALRLPIASRERRCCRCGGATPPVPHRRDAAARRHLAHYERPSGTSRHSDWGRRARAACCSD